MSEVASSSRRGRGGRRSNKVVENHHDVDERDDDTARAATSGKSSSQKQRRNKKKVRVMGDSGQTDAERRELRNKQRSLQKSITEEVGDSMEDPNSGAFETVRAANNELWDHVRYAREAVLDGENLDLISSRAARQVDRLLQVPRYDAVKLVRKLRDKCSRSNSTFDWSKLGQAAGAIFNAVPCRTVSFLHGPLTEDYVPKERKRAERAKRARMEDEEDEDDEDENARAAAQKGSGADRLSAVEKNMRDITKALKRRCHDELETEVKEYDETHPDADPSRRRRDVQEIEANNHVCAVNFLFNPKSFTQTVENVFNFAFLIKKGDAKIQVVEKDGRRRPMVTVMSPKDNLDPRQAVVPLTMRDWRDMCAKFEVKKGDIPHRPSGGNGGGRAGSKRKSTAVVEEEGE